MKLVLTALNAKYIHTCLSVRCLYGAIRDLCDCRVREYTINDEMGEICRELFCEKADCIAFSCYIWNIDKVLSLSSLLKKAEPKLKIILGGYEVMYDSESVLEQNPQIDAIIRGEGEITLREYIEALEDKKPLNEIAGITYRDGNSIISNHDRSELCDLNALPFVYDDSIDEFKNKIIYYESSRGCPYGCTYCISGQTGGVRFLGVERVKKELAFFMEHRVPLVKFVDRTFNADPKRAKEILKFIRDKASDTVFHMELAGDIIDDEVIDIASHIPKGGVRFEIGVQTTNPDTMRHINRNISFKRLSDSVRKLMDLGTVHIHLDLIAGLPHEDYESLKKSFDDVIMLRPNVLQLGFLKLLKGSVIREDEEKYGYVYSDKAPYEVISNDFISYDEILCIKCAEDALEKYYNSECFLNTIDVLFERYSCKFDLFLNIGKYLKSKYSVGYAFSKSQLFEELYEFACKDDKTLFEALKKDYLLSFRIGKRPLWFDEADLSLLPKVYEMFKNEELKKEHFPMYYDVPAKEVMKHMYAERFSSGVLLFDYKYGNVTEIAGFLS